MSDKKLHISSSPHFSLGLSTKGIMACVLLALLPECIFGVMTFGIRALIVILTSVAACVAFEALFQLVTKQKIVVSNLSACVTGVMLALVCPANVPLWQLILGDLVAVVIAKGLFGGIGSNVFNPALTGRAFMFMSFPAAMGAQWLKPGLAEKWSLAKTAITESSIDAVTGATVLNSINGKYDGFQIETLKQYFFGHQGGCIGETSAFLILLSFAFLLLTRIIDWRAPVAMVGTFIAATFLLSFGKSHDTLSSLQTVAMQAVSGGLLFGATFMITDYSTAPVTKAGRLIFGAGAGLITFLIRQFGGYPEGVMFSILIMNSVAPFLNNITSRKYGYGKEGHRKPNDKKPVPVKKIVTASVLVIVIACLAVGIVRNDKRIKAKEFLSTVFSDAARLTEAENTYVPETEGVVIEKLYKAFDAKGNDIGMIARAYGPTYDRTTILVHVSKDGLIKKVHFVDSTDSPGLGKNASGEEFCGQFAGMDARVRLVPRNYENEGNFDSITGATQTVNGVAAILNDALAAITGYQDKMNSTKEVK